MKAIFISLLLTFSVDSFSQEERKKDSIVKTYVNDLEEIVIVKKKDTYVQKPDRMLFNVENSIVSEGSSALDVLARAPGVIVSQDGDLSIRGQLGVSVMIDGKLSHLSQKELTNFLKSTTSSGIKQIEVITNPSAKYDAAGKAGIINIIMKKNRATGIKGTLHTSYGLSRKNRTNSGLNLNYNKNKWGIYGNYNYTYRGEEERKNYKQIQFEDSEREKISAINNQYSKTDEPLTTNNFKIGMQYQLSEKTNLELAIDAKLGRYNNLASGQNLLLDSAQQTQLDVLTYNDNKEKWNDYNYTLSGKHKFNTDGDEISFDLEYENSKFKSNQLQTTNNNIIANDRRGFIPSKLEVITAKTDINNTINDNSKMEWGFKTSFKNNDIPSEYEFLEDDQWQNDANSTNHFVYKEQIHAAYANYKYQFKNFNIQAGLRAEYTSIEITQKTLQQNNKNNYLKWFPSFALKYELTENNTFHLSYSKRINRPNQYDLNPFRFYNDTFNYYQGNPDLVPEITNTAEIGYNWKNILMTSLYFNKTKDVFTEVYNYNQDNNTTVTTQINISKSVNYGTNITTNTKLYKWWTVNTLFNIFENRFKGNTVNNNTITPIITYNLNVQNSFNISKNWKAEATTQYQSKSNVGVYVRKDFFDLSLGFSKQILAEKGSIKFNITDVLKTTNYTIHSNIGQTFIDRKYNLDSRVATLTFTYRI